MKVKSISGPILSILFSVGLSMVVNYAIRHVMAESAANQDASNEDRRPVSNRNPTMVFVVVPVLVGNSGNHFGPYFERRFLRRNRRKR